jgi:hypothetical protein
VTKKHNFVYALLIGTMFVLLTGCSKKKNEEISIPQDYPSWQRTTEKDLDYMIPGHGDTIRRIYINDIGTEVEISQEEGRDLYNYPEGTVIVKEHYPSQSAAENKEIESITAMIKAPQDPRARGGWLWLSKDPDTGETRVFTQEFCITCHENANEAHPYGDENREEEFRDYVFFPYSESEVID